MPMSCPTMTANVPMGRNTQMAVAILSMILKASSLIPIYAHEHHLASPDHRRTSMNLRTC